MSEKQSIYAAAVCLAALVVLIFAGRFFAPVSPVPFNAIVSALDVAGVSDDDKRAAAVDGRLLFATWAECLRFDGTRKSPLYLTGIQVDDFGVNLRAFFMRDRRFGARFPKLGEVVAADLRQAFGEDLSGPIDRARLAEDLDRLAAKFAAAEESF